MLRRPPGGGPPSTFGYHSRVAHPLERLRQAGLGVGSDTGAEDVRTECTRLAGVLLARGVRLIGLLPAGVNVAVPAVAVQLGRSLVALTGSPIGVIDATGTWPGLAIAGSTVGASLFAATWLEDNLAVLSPRTFDPGGMLRNIGSALAEEAAIFAAVLVDMTGFEHMGEHLAGIALVDGVIVVARAGRTTEDQVARWMREVPRERNLGILLTGVR